VAYLLSELEIINKVYYGTNEYIHSRQNEIDESAYLIVVGKIDIITGKLGKALGGASGGFTSGRKEIIEMLRQRSRP